MFLQIKILSIPIPSMYGIFTYIWLFFGVDVGKYAIHRSYGIEFQQSINLENKFSLCNCFLTCFFSSSSLGSAVSSGISCLAEWCMKRMESGKNTITPPKKRYPPLTESPRDVILRFLASNLVVELRPWKTTMEPKKWAKKNPQAILLHFGTEEACHRRRETIHWSRVPSTWRDSQVEPRKKNGLTFHSTGCLIGISGSLKWIYTIPIWLGSIIPYIP